MNDLPQLVVPVAVAAIVVWLDGVGFLRWILSAAPLFGLPKAILFGCVMRANWMAAHRGAGAGLPWGASAYTFEGGDDVGLIFLPGACVDAAAYAPLLRRVAADARATVVLARPAFRHPMTFGGVRRFRAIAAAHPNVKTWAVGGHSMGAGRHGAAGVAADALAGDALAHGAVLRGVALLAGSITGDLDLSRTALRGLQVLASEDTIVSPKRGAKAEDGSLVRDGRRKLPRRTRFEVVRGGNHASFGAYGPQTFPFPDGALDGITPDDQQDQTARHLVAFLKGLKR